MIRAQLEQLTKLQDELVQILECYAEVCELEEANAFIETVVEDLDEKIILLANQLDDPDAYYDQDIEIELPKKKNSALRFVPEIVNVN